MTRKQLNIGTYHHGDGVKMSSFHLPLDFVTQTSAGVGVRGSGKTNTYVVLTEEMLAAGLQTVIIDPLDVWWGLRSNGAGTGPGFPIVVMGGEHADVPLTASAGDFVANFLVNNRASAVLSLRHLSKTAQRQFVADLAESLYHLKGQARFRDPMHLIIDECDLYCPQMVRPDMARVSGAIDDLVRRGRSSGIGVSLISQRTAKINKDVLSQVDFMFALKLVGPQDRHALNEWVEVHDDGSSERVMGTLHQLERGQAWVWGPGAGILEKVQIRQRTTYDSSATPKLGEKMQPPKQIAPVDIQKLTEGMSLIIAEKERSDPKVLWKKINELNTALQALEKANATPKESPDVMEKLKAANAKIIRLRVAVQQINGLIAIIIRDANQINEVIGPIILEGDPERADPKLLPGLPPPTKKNGVIITPISEKHVRVTRDPDYPMTKCEREILKVLFNFPCTRGKLSILSGYTYSGTFRNALSALRTSGLISGGNNDTISITQAGRNVIANMVVPLPTGQALIEHWKNQLNKCERAIFEVLCEADALGLTKDQIIEQLARNGTPYEFSGTFRNALSKLRTMGIIEGSNSQCMKASPHLFEHQGTPRE